MFVGSFVLQFSWRSMKSVTDSNTIVFVSFTNWTRQYFEFYHLHRIIWEVTNKKCIKLLSKKHHILLSQKDRKASTGTSSFCRGGNFGHYQAVSFKTRVFFTVFKGGLGVCDSLGKIDVTNLGKGANMRHSKSAQSGRDALSAQLVIPKSPTRTKVH